jgi:hypothetical protein
MSTPATVKKPAEGFEICRKDEHVVAHLDFRDCPIHAAATVMQKYARGLAVRRRIVASMPCILFKFEKSPIAESEKQIVGRAKVIFEESCGIRFLVLHMENDESSHIPSPVRIALKEGSSCSYSKKRKCVRFDVVWYKSLETHSRIVEIMSNIKGAFRLYVDFGSISINLQFRLDYLVYYGLLHVVMKALQDVKTRVRHVNSDTIHDSVKESLKKAARSNRNNRKYLMLPEKSKLKKSVSSLPNCSSIWNSDWERPSRFNTTCDFVMSFAFNPVNPADSFS